jgi:CO/xanthine dehydrogenase FAD-binding subunit
MFRTSPVESYTYYLLVADAILTVHQTGSTKSLGTLDFYQLPSTTLVNSPFNPITLHIVAVCVNRIGTK